MNNLYSFKTEDIIAVQIYLEKRKTRLYVGKLTCENKNGKKVFHLDYEPAYLKSKQAIPLGPNLPLTQYHYESAVLFPFFEDRIPSKENAAYADYCKMTGISVHEQNPIVLLCTIGKKGPSSFIFEPLFVDNFSKEDLKNYRQELGLTIREFAALFDISFSHLQRIESGKFSGKEILKRIECYQKFPEVALYEILKQKGVLHSDKQRKLIEFLKMKIIVHGAKTKGTGSPAKNIAILDKNKDEDKAPVPEKTNPHLFSGKKTTQ